MVSVGLGPSQTGTGRKVFHGKAFLALAFQRVSLLLLLLFILFSVCEKQEELLGILA